MTLWIQKDEHDKDMLLMYTVRKGMGAVHCDTLYEVFGSDWDAIKQSLECFGRALIEATLDGDPGDKHRFVRER